MSDSPFEMETARDYLAGRLADAESREFETRLVRDPSLVRALEEQLRLREGLEVLRERGELRQLIASRPTWRRWVLPVAAAVGPVTVALLLARFLVAPAPMLTASMAELGFDAAASGGAPAQFSFATTRGADAGPALELPAAGAVEIRVLVGDAAARRYRLVLRALAPDGHSRELGAVPHLTPDHDGFVSAYLDAARLEPGAFAVSAQPEGAGGPAPEDVTFRWHRTEPPRQR